MNSVFRKFSSVCVVLLAVSFSFASEYVDAPAKVSDISYRQEPINSEYAKTQCKLDIFYPKDTEDYPTIVWFHPGSLTMGDKQWGVPFAERFAAEGFGVVLVGYRLSPKAKNPAYIEDAAAAVAWTFKNIAKYGGNPDEVYLSGHSAGGYLAAIISLDERYLEKHKIPVQRIAGIIPISGQMVTHSTILIERGIPEGTIIVDEFSPIYHSRKAGPACLCICGDNDLPLRADENVFFIRALKNAGNKNARYLEIKDRNHFTIGTKFQEKGDEVTHAILEFISKL
jgi:acetyl esterase/lipase